MDKPVPASDHSLRDRFEQMAEDFKGAVRNLSAPALEQPALGGTAERVSNVFGAERAPAFRKFIDAAFSRGLEKAGLLDLSDSVDIENAAKRAGQAVHASPLATERRSNMVSSALSDSGKTSIAPR